MNIDTPCQTRIAALRSLWRDAFGDTADFRNAFFSTAFSTNRCRCVMVNDEIVAALYWFDCLHMGRRVAYLYAVATAKAYRSQGICHKLINDTHLHLTKLGYTGTILVPGSKELFSLYKSMGYQTCSHIGEFRCTGEAQSIPLYPIAKTEYASLRRQLLPIGGLVQEKENLDFLETQAKLYAGSDFLLAAREEANALYGVELLGNMTAAAGIVRALGYAQGTFRTPGNTRPFAMYHTLDKGKLPSPTYLGLAFD